jgi:hypothetical protein
MWLIYHFFHQEIFLFFKKTTPFPRVKNTSMRSLTRQPIDRGGRGEIVGARVNHLGDCDMAGAESRLTVAEIVAPFANEGLIETEFPHLIQFHLEILPPTTKGARVVRGHVFVFKEIQIPAGCHSLCDARVTHKERPGKNMLLNKIHSVAEDRILTVRTEDRLKTQQTLWTQQ